MDPMGIASGVVSTRLNSPVCTKDISRVSVSITRFSYLIGSMGRRVYLLYLHLVDFFMVNVGKHTIHGLFGYWVLCVRAHWMTHPKSIAVSGSLNRSLIGGRWYIITQLAISTTSILPIGWLYMYYMLPTTFYGNQKQPLTKIALRGNRSNVSYISMAILSLQHR